MQAPAANRVTVLGLVVAFALGGCGTTPAPSNASSLTTDGSNWDRIPEIVAQVEPSVVTIIRAGAEGSGVVWSADGVVITNNHVVEGVTKVIVVFADGSESNAKVTATDPLSDLAVVRTERQGLPPAHFATTIPRVGSLAIALGNPLGFENSATAGIISGTHRAIPGAAQQAPALVDLIQTDAPISPGNSGGALVGADEQVIGVNVAYIPPQAGSVSIGFAIPAPTVTDVVTQLLKSGKAEHAYLGVRAIPLTPELIAQLKIKATEGAIVAGIAEGSPAAAAGIKPGDVIVGLGDANVQTVEDMLGALRQHRPGEKVPVRIIREGKEMTVEVTLGEFPS